MEKPLSMCSTNYSRIKWQHMSKHIGQPISLVGWPVHSDNNCIELQVDEQHRIVVEYSLEDIEPYYREYLEHLLIKKDQQTIIEVRGIVVQTDNRQQQQYQQIGNGNQVGLKLKEINVFEDNDISVVSLYYKMVDSQINNFQELF